MELAGYYVNNDFGPLRLAFVKEAQKQGVDICKGQPVEWLDRAIIFIIDGYITAGNVYNGIELILEDFGPKNYKYDPVNFAHAWEAFQEHEQNPLWHGSKFGHEMIADGVLELASTIAEGNQLYRRVECEWYDNIPKGGVLCWTWDHSEETKKIRQIERYNPDASFPFSENRGVKWINATPLTKAEIQAFMDNVPE